MLHELSGVIFKKDNNSFHLLNVHYGPGTLRGLCEH